MTDTNEQGFSLELDFTEEPYTPPNYEFVESKASSYDEPKKPTDFITNWSENFPVGHLIEYIKDLPGAYIAGGCFKNIFNKEPVKDIDIFFETHYHWHNAQKKYKETYGDPVYENKRVMAFYDEEKKLRIELIGSEPDESDASWWESMPEDDPRTYGTPEEVISMFDFTITKFALYARPLEAGMVQYECLYHPQFFEHLMLKRLIIDDELIKPFSSFERALRYTKYGYSLCKDSKVELVERMKEEEFSDPAQISLSFYDGMD